MAEVDATIPDNSEPPQAPADEPPAPATQAADAPPKRGRGRPAGAKDKAPRAKPRVRVEPIPQPEPQAKPAPAQASEPAADPVGAVEARSPSPEPLSPRTLYRQTSAHLLNLRDVMNIQRRASAAERYTSRLQAWPVV
jgi:hypothetical protein